MTTNNKHGRKLVDTKACDDVLPTTSYAILTPTMKSVKPVKTKTVTKKKTMDYVRCMYSSREEVSMKGKYDDNLGHYGGSLCVIIIRV